MKVRIHSSPYRYCRAIAHARAEGHMAKGSKTGPEDKEKRIRMEVRSTVCEFAFSLLSDTLSGQFRGDVELKGDGGWDYQLSNGRRIDVKSGPPNCTGMVVGTKNLDRCDTFVMSRYDERAHEVEFLGWINSKDVLANSEECDLKAWRGRPHVRVALEKLRPMSELEIV